MSETEPTREQAVAALSDVHLRAAQVHRADGGLRWMLLATLAAYAGGGLVMSISPHRGSTLGLLGVIAMVIAAIAFVIVVAMRIRAYSRPAILVFLGTILTFNLWNAIVVSVSIGTQFWASTQPSYHFGISAAVAMLPLVGGFVLLARARD